MVMPRIVRSRSPLHRSQAVRVDVDAWDAWTPVEIANRLDGVHGAWAVAGGWAIDLFVEDEPRDHEDVEVLTSRGRGV